MEKEIKSFDNSSVYENVMRDAKFPKHIEYKVGFEAIKNFSTNLYLYINGAVWGRVNVHYNPVTDCLEISIKNRAFNMEPFHMTYPEFSKEMRYGTSSGLIGNHVLSEYRDYINQYIYKRG